MTDQSAPRVARSVLRLLREVRWIKTEQTALERLERLEDKDVSSLDFFQVAHTALMGERLIRLVRVFEDSAEVASFWYLHRCRPREVEALVKGAGSSLEELQDFTEGLKSVRDKSFVHIDKNAVFDPAAIYQAAGITGRQIRASVEALWSVLNALHLAISGEAFVSEEYDGAHIDVLHELHVRNRATPGGPHAA